MYFVMGLALFAEEDYQGVLDPDHANACGLGLLG